MASGVVKWFNEQNGFGFIEQDEGDDVFLHYSAISGDGFRTVFEGQRVEFDVGQSPQGPRAETVKVPDDQPLQ